MIWVEDKNPSPEKLTKNVLEERFCCWCGKVEHTKNCQSKSLKRVINEAIKHYREIGWFKK